MRDLYHNIAVSQPLNPVVSSTTKTSSAIDLQGFESAVVLFSVGLSGDTLSGSVYWTLKLQHSDDNSTYTDIAASDNSAGVATVVIDAAAEDEVAVVFGYVGSKRYLKALATPTGTHTNGTPIGMIALRGNATYLPAA
ncbi:MAG: hypothetical protein SFT92_02180 [Rickettsiales bacterium]|nr:hypothetical protein [Rickettsiales bacterium]